MNPPLAPFLGSRSDDRGWMLADILHLDGFLLQVTRDPIRWVFAGRGHDTLRCRPRVRPHSCAFRQASAALTPSGCGPSPLGPA